MQRRRIAKIKALCLRAFAFYLFLSAKIYKKNDSTKKIPLRFARKSLFLSLVM